MSDRKIVFSSPVTVMLSELESGAVDRDLLAPERAVADALGVSRATVRRRLVDEGLLDDVREGNKYYLQDAFNIGMRTFLS